MKLSDLWSAITKKEWQLVILFIVVMIILTTVPYIYGYWQTPAEYFYLGTHSISPGDTYVYFSYINQIKSGQWLIQDLFTSEPQTGLLNILWLVVGLLAAIFNLTPFLAFQIFRIILIPVFIICLYLLISFFVEEKTRRQLTLAFLLFSSGVGAYFATYFDKIFPYDASSLIYKWPIDLWVAESNIFLTLYQSPHFILSLACLIVFSLLLLLALLNNNYKYSLLAGVVGLLWFNFHPYYFIMIALIFLVYVGVLFYKTWQFSYWWHYGLAFAISAVSVIYHYYLISTDSIISLRAGQNITLTPPALFIVTGFGFLLLGAILAIMILIKQKKLFSDDKNLFLLVWLVVGLIVLYIPIQFQRKFLMGVQIPMVILAVYCLNYFYEYAQAKFKFKPNIIILSFFFVLMFGFSTLFNLIRDYFYYADHSAIFYQPTYYQQAVAWLNQNNQANKVVLSAEYDGYLVAGLAKQRVYLGHGHETVNYEAKTVLVKDFLNNSFTREQEKHFLIDNNIGYLVISPVEQQIGAYEIVSRPYWQAVFHQQDLIIYQFKP